MIYRLPLIAWSSVTVRITGLIASAGFFVVGGATLYKGGGWVADTAQDLDMTTQRWTGRDFGSIPTFVAKFSIAYLMAYQWLGSARHMVWDLTAMGFTNQKMLQSAYAMFGASAVISLALAMYSLPPSSKSEKQ